MNLKVGLVIGALMGSTLLQPVAFGQDAAWEGLINAGRNALQQKSFSEAERHFEAALEAAESFPLGDARLGKSYNNLAAVYYAQEDYARAEPLMRRALAQLRETLGPENTEVAQTMKNLAALYYLQGNRSEAEALLKQSLEILEKIHGPNHAFVATVLSNLAGLYQAENRYGEAEPLLTRSLVIWESLLGPDHPDVVRSRDLLDRVRQAKGGGQVPGTATAAVSPRALVPAPLPVPLNDESEAPGAGTAELAGAREAMEALTTSSKAEADREKAERATVEDVPAPALSPVDDVRIAETEAVPTAGEGEAAEPPSGAAERDDVLTGGDVEGGDEPDDIVTSALEPLDEGAEATTAVATAILQEAASVEDVSFAVYLSTLWSIDEARLYWQAMQDVMPDILEGKSMEIEEVAATGGADPFYRVLTMPYTSDPEAQAACELIKSKLRTHDCSVVVRDAATDG